jgi:uncharacterized protein
MGTMRSSELRISRFIVASGCLAAGLFFFAIVIARDRLLAPSSFEPALQIFFPIVFFLVHPLQMAIESIAGSDRLHPPWEVLFAASLTAPWACWFVIEAIRFGRRRQAAARAVNIATPKSSDRRRFLSLTARAIPVVTVAGTAAHALFLEPGRLRVTKYDIAVRNLPVSLDGLRIAQLSDTHYGPFITLDYLKAAIVRTNRLEPDLVVLTGDYVHKTPRAIDPGVELFRALRPRLGVAAVLGNHDHWEGADEVRKAFRRIDIPIIDNSRLFLSSGGISGAIVEGESLCIAGVGDLWEDAVSFDDALGGISATTPRILLAHNPDTAEVLELRAHRVDLMISGHTHGGQVAFPGVGAPLVPIRHKKYAAGLCRGPVSPVIVSCGIGMAMLPLRLGVPPEIVQITLRRI